MDYTFHWRPVWKALPDLLGGAWLTMQVAVLGMALGIVLGMLLALGRMSRSGALRRGAGAWVELARNTPALFQIYAVYFGLGAFGLHLSSYVSMVAALAFNNAGYLAETFRGGFQAVPATQMRAARSLGMSVPQAQLHILIPQVLRIVYHPVTNQFIWSILVSSLGLFIGLKELSGQTQFLASKSFRIFEFFAVTAVVYYAIAKIVLWGARLLSARLFRQG